IWAADLFTVQTVTFRTLYVLFFITHGRRELLQVTVTAHPTAAWVWRQLVEAPAWGRRPRHLRRDRDAGYGGGVPPRAQGAGEGGGGVRRYSRRCVPRAPTRSRSALCAPSETSAWITSSSLTRRTSGSCSGST